MTIAKRVRSRVVYFRVSDEEYAHMTRACETEGARTLSELIRLMLDRHLTQGPATRATLQAQLKQMDELIESLQLHLATLELLLAKQRRPPEDSEPSGS